VAGQPWAECHYPFGVAERRAPATTGIQPSPKKSKRHHLAGGASGDGVNQLLRTLVNPGADETNLLGRERLDARLVVQRRHPAILVFRQVGDGLDNEAVRAVTDLDDGPVLGALEDAVECIHVQVCLGFLAAVALHAGGVKNGFDVRGIGYASLGGGGGQVGGGGGPGNGERGRHGGQEQFGRIHDRFIWQISLVVNGQVIRRHKSPKGSNYFLPHHERARTAPVAAGILPAVEPVLPARRQRLHQRQRWVMCQRLGSFTV